KGFATAVDITMQAADISPLRRGAITQPTALLPVALRAKLNANANELALESIAGVIGGSPVRGKLKLALGTRKRIEGQIDADTIDMPALLAIAAGMPRSVARTDAPAWAGEPFGEGALNDFEGLVDFTAGRAALTPALIARQARGTVRFSMGEVAVENLEGTLGGGRARNRDRCAAHSRHCRDRARWWRARGAAYRCRRDGECRAGAYHADHRTRAERRSFVYRER